MRTASVFLLVLLAAAVPAARAEGRFTLPLPASDLPDGELTVKVVGDNLRDLKVGQEVKLHQVKAEDTTQIATVKTGPDGRARFQGLKPSERYVVFVAFQSQEHRSAPFPGPERGGIRLLLTLGAATMPRDMTRDMTRGMGRDKARALPPGHPPTSQPARPEEPEGPGAATIEALPELEKGQLQIVVVRGKDRRPLAGASVTLERDGNKLPSLARTDAEGQTTAILEEGRHHAQVTHDGLTYRSRSFKLPASGGVRATFQVFDRTRSAAKLALGRQSHWVAQIGERVVRFMHVIQLANEADAIIDPKQPLAFPLPDGARRVEIPAELQGILVLDEPRRRVRLAAPVPPGGLPLRVYFEVPYQGATLDFRQVLPLRQEASAVLLMNGGKAMLSGPAITGTSQPNEGGEGTVFPVAAAEGGRAVEFTFTGLPRRDRRPLYVALALAGLVALWGLLAALGGPRVAEQRRERREQLLDQLAQLSKKSGGKKSRSRDSKEKREQLRQELIHVWEEW
jgi:hypothetical protein